MIRINLSPGELSFRQPMKVTTEIASAVIIILMAVYAPGLYAERLREDSYKLQEEIASKQQSLRSMRTTSQDINRLKSTIADIKYRANKIKDLTKGRKQSVFALDKLQQQHPERLWLESVSIKGEMITVTGISSETKLISEYATRIKNLNENIEGSDDDIENFIPPFSKYIEGEQHPEKVNEIRQKESVLPLKISDVLIQRTDLTQINNVNVYRFAISMNIDLPDDI